MTMKRAHPAPSSQEKGRSAVACIPFHDYPQSVTAALDQVEAHEALPHLRPIVIKPNLVTADPPPVTTPPGCVEAVISYCRRHSDAEIVVAEGSGGGDTRAFFESLGYVELSRRTGVELVDLDREETVRLENPGHICLPEFHLPSCLIGAFIISVPVLKAHSMTGVTLSLKNMMGVAPASRYAGSAFRKSRLHGRNNEELHRNIIELNSYCGPALSVIDASIGMAEAHLWGPRCEPPVNRILASCDPVAADAVAAGLLGRDWQDVGHIAWANGVLGNV